MHVRLIVSAMLFLGIIAAGCTQVATATPTPTTTQTPRPTVFIPQPDFAIDSPRQAQQVEGPQAQLIISSAVHKPASTYFILTVDDGTPIPFTGFNYTLTGLDVGKHKVKVQRVNKDGSQVKLADGSPDPLTTREVTFTVYSTATPTPRKVFEILAPRQGDVLNQTNVTVKLNTSNTVGTTNVSRKGEGHFRISIDETPFVKVKALEHVLENLEPDKHVLRVVWVNNDGTPVTLKNGELDPATAQQITFITNTTNPTTTTAPTPSQTVKINEINMTATKFSYSPSTINAKKGEVVRLVINSTDTTHGISIPELNVDESLPVGVKTIEFNASKTGTFTFRCSTFCGSGHGQMTGQIIITG